MDKIPEGSLKFLVSNGTIPTMIGGFLSFRFFDSFMNVVYHDQDGNALVWLRLLSRFADAHTDIASTFTLTISHNYHH